MGRIALLIILCVCCAFPQAFAGQYTAHYTANQRNLWSAFQAYYHLATCHRGGLVDRRELDEWTELLGAMMANAAAREPALDPHSM
jgi:hypothetical protein